MFRLSSLILFIGSWLWSAPPAWAAPVPPDHECMGRWVGQGQNSNSASSWTIDLTMTASPSGGRCGTIEYTNPACGGSLESCRLVGADIHTREHYTHNDGSCAPAGQVIIRCEGDRMRYSWIGWERVDSILHRPGVAPGGQPGTTQPSSPGTPSPPPGQMQPPTVPQPPPGVPVSGTPPNMRQVPPPPPAPNGQGSGLFGCSLGPADAGPPGLFLVSIFLLLARRRP